MLVVDSVSFAYQYRQILRELSFTVGPGQLVQLVGPNGAGKSTLVAIIAGLMAEQSGSVSYHVDGKQHSDYRRYCEYLPAEANGLYLKLDALSNLRFWQELRGITVDKQRLLTELTSWGLGSPLVYQNFPVEKFSTGMKRRLALARVQLANVPLWLLDEPLYGLDRNGVAVWQSCMQAHLDAGGMVVVVSHEQEALRPLNPRQVEVLPTKVGNKAGTV